MKNSSSCYVAVLVLVALLVIPLNVADAATWTETTDAGTLPSTASVSSGLGSLDLISGSIDSAGEDVDMYTIQIVDPDAFSAGVTGEELGLLDTYLFLFDAAGNGVLANDDGPGLPPNPLSEIAAGDLAGHSPGLYHLAVSTVDDVPINASSEQIFDVWMSSGSVSPVASDTLLADWLPDGNLFINDYGSYTILLTGAGFAEVTETAVPEPSSLVFSLLGLLALLIRHRIRRAV